MKCSLPVRTTQQILYRSLLILVLASQARAFAANDCDIETASSDYRPANSDIVTERHLDVARPFSGQGSFEVKICGGELRILPSQDGRLHLSIELRNSVNEGIVTFVRKIEVQDGKAIISLAYPKNSHPFIALRVPSTDSLHSEITLGYGKLEIQGNALKGDRVIHVGTGKVFIYLRGDTEYSELSANVGMGSFRDRRPGGVSKHSSVTQSLRGKGNGRIEANVGVGSIEVRAQE